MMKFLIIYMLVSAVILVILVVTGLCKFKWTECEPSFKNGLVTILYLLAIILVWPIIVLVLIIDGRKKGRK